MYCHVPVILALISEEGDDKFQASTGYIVKLFHKKTKKLNTCKKARIAVMFLLCTDIKKIVGSVC